MDHYFVSHEKVRRYFVPVAGMALDAVAYVERDGAVKEGTPFILGADMRPAEPLCSFFFQLSKSLAASTMAGYAHDLLDLAAFLSRLQSPADLLSASEDDLVAYREHCTRDRERPVSAATWKRRRAAVNSFYGWAVQTGRLVAWPYFRRPGGRDVLAWGATADLDVRCLTYRQWRLLRQVGLRGLLPGGDADRSFRGAAPLRNCAAAELAVTTGMRLREFSCLLDLEVPQPGRDGLPVTVRLQATAKYGLPRDVLVQHATLREIDVYRRTERAAVVRRSAAALARRSEELFVVSDIDTAAMRLTGCLHGRRRVFRVEAMPAQLRRIAVAEGSRGLEPMALFAGRGGRMPTKQRWEQVFAAAYGRAVRVAAGQGLPVEMPRRFRIHDLRHTFAVFMLQQLTELVIEAERDQRDAGGHGGYLADHIARNPLLIVQRLLGHRAPSSTMRYLTYLGQTNALVAQAVAEWNDAEASYADYAALLAGGEGPLMPRRGEHHAVRVAGPPAVPGAGFEAGGLAQLDERTGVRVVQSRHRDTVRSYRVDPQAFACSLLAAQLADEWVSYARVAALADGSRYAAVIRSFAGFTGRWCRASGADPAAARLDGGPVDLAGVIRGWETALRQEHGPRSQQPYQSTVALFTLIGQRAARDPGVGERLRARAAARPMFGKGATTPLAEFPNAERLMLRKMARADITALEARLARGAALLASGADPRLQGWGEPANLLWAARHAILTTAALHAGLPEKVTAWPAAVRQMLGTGAGHRHGRFGLMMAAAGLLFPCEQDLQPFRVLLLLAMADCTPEELADLTLADIEFSDGAVRLRQAKARAGRVRIRLHPPAGLPPADGGRVHHGSGNWDIPGLVRRLLAVTAASRETFHAGDWLFLAVEARDYDTRLGAQAARFKQGGRRFTHWIAAHPGEDGAGPVVSVPHDARRLRKTAKTTRVAALGGTLTDLAGDDHHVEVFRGHYAHGTTAHVLAARAVNAAQGKVFQKTRAHPVFLDTVAESRLADPEVAGAAGLSAGQAAAMGAGQLDMGLTNCRDPYDSPHTPAGTLCHVAPAMCMLCRNAVVFTAQLPRLLQLAGHIQAQRDVLGPPRWQAVWGRQSAALAELFAACPEETAQARAEAKASPPLDLPLGMRTEYHR